MADISTVAFRYFRDCYMALSRLLHSIGRGAQEYYRHGECRVPSVQSCDNFGLLRRGRYDFEQLAAGGFTMQGSLVLAR